MRYEIIMLLSWLVQEGYIYFIFIRRGGKTNVEKSRK